MLQVASGLGGTIFVAVAQSVLQSALVKDLKSILPNIDPQILAGQGASSLRSMVSGDQLPEVLRRYNGALRNVWYLALGLAAATLVSAFGIEWRSVKETKNKKKKKDDEEKRLQADAKSKDEAGENEDAMEMANSKQDTTTEVVAEVKS